MATKCRVCESLSTEVLLDFGLQPNSLRFLSAPDVLSSLHPLALSVCRSCGFVFIADPMPQEAFYIDVQQPTLNSVPLHLDALIENFVANLSSDASVLDIGANSGALLARFREAGLVNLYGIEPADVRQLALEQGLDVVGGYFSKDWARNFLATHGAPDLVVCRHVLEHVTSLGDFVAGLSLLLECGATLVLETPDLQATAERGDCSVIWEQHVNYFDLSVLNCLFCNNNLRIVQSQRIPFGGGALLCFVVHKTHVDDSCAGARGALPSKLGAELSRNVLRRISDLRNYVVSLKSQGYRVAGYGAGERGAMVVNLCGLGGMLEYVVDDSPQKAGRFLSGSCLPVVSCDSLRQFPPDYCIIFPMNGKEVEDRIISRLEGLAQRGVVFVELFPASGDTVAEHTSVALSAGVFEP